jgi:RNA-directed DNA polymerase
MRIRAKDLQPALVFEETTQAGQADLKVYADPSIWTSRMLTTLGNGVHGGKWYSLGDKALSVKALDAAFARVKANGGAPGVDGWTVERFDSQKEENLLRISSELLGGSYRPSPVKRVMIPKPGTNEKRPLGIPTVRDRVVQSAVKAAIEPIFEQKFCDASFGFRPGRSCKQALRRVWLGLKAGRVFVVDVDLRRFFDTIPHEIIMRGLETEISDGKVLSLVRSYLKQGVMSGGVWLPEAEDSEEGVPQGSPLSPLLANVALHDLDALMEEAGYELTRYADDFVILCQTREQAEAALERVRSWTETVGLSLHPEKTRIVDYGVGQPFEFLGHAFRKGKVFPRKKSVQNIRNKIRDKTPRNSGKSLKAIIASLNPVLRGWFGYFQDCPESAFPDVDSFVRRRLRAILDIRIGKHPAHRGATAIRWPNAYFAARGLYSMVSACKERSTLLKANH